MYRYLFALWFDSVILHVRSCKADSGSRSHRFPSLSETLSASPHSDWGRRGHDVPLRPVARGTGSRITVIQCDIITVDCIYRVGRTQTWTQHVYLFLFFFQGVKRFDARERVICALMERKLFREKRDHPMSLPICRLALKLHNSGEKFKSWTQDAILRSFESFLLLHLGLFALSCRRVLGGAAWTRKPT